MRDCVYLYMHLKAIDQSRVEVDLENEILSNISYAMSSLLSEYKQCEKFFDGQACHDALVLLKKV